MNEVGAEAVSLGHYARVLWRRRWLIALAFTVAAASALLLSNRQTPQYQATAKVFIGPRAAERGDLSSAIEELNFSKEFVASYGELFKSRPLAERVVEQLGLAAAPGDLAGRVKTKIVTDTRIIEVSLTDSDAGRAESTLNALVTTFVADVVGSFGGRAGAQASVLEPALRPESPVSPKPMRDGVLGAMLGLMIGVGAAFLLEQMDTTFRDREDIEQTLAPLPVLAAIPSVATNGGARRLFVEQDPKAPAAEAFRMLRTNVQFLGVDKPVRTLLVTSPYAEDGKSTVASNLAAAIAAGGRRTLIIESDLRRPVVHDMFDVPQSPGLTDVLVGRATLAQTIRPSRIPGLAVLPAGHLPPNPSELLGSRKLVDLLAEARVLADVIVLDTPPALPVADASVLGAHVDGVILVVRAGRTHRERAKEAVATFERLGARILGIVLNDVGAGSGYYYYYYHRYYGSTPNGQEKDGRAKDGRAKDGREKNGAPVLEGLGRPGAAEKPSTLAEDSR